MGTYKVEKKKPYKVEDDIYDDILNENQSAYNKVDGKKDSNAYTRPTDKVKIIGTGKTKVKHPILQGASRKNLKNGIIYAEILGKAKGL